MIGDDDEVSRAAAVIIAVVLALVALAVVAAFGLQGWQIDSGQPRRQAATSTGPIEIRPVSVIGETLEELPRRRADPAIGMTAPTLVGFSPDGRPLTIDPGADGRPMLIAFFAHWCPHCNYQVPEMIEWRDKGQVPPDLQIVAITTSTDPNDVNYPPSRWLADFGWQWPVFADSEKFDAAEAYGLSGLPFIVVLDAEGRVVRRFAGETPRVLFDNNVRDALGLS